MRIALISNIRDGKGLAVDARILDRLLTKWGHDVHQVDFRDVDRRDFFYTVVIHLEVVAPKAFSWSDKHLWFINPDWAKAGYLQWADAFRVILAKSHEGLRVLREAGLKRVEHVGFESEDRFMPHVKRERVFLHSWSGSMMKGTRQVLAAWGLRECGTYPCSFHFGGRRLSEQEWKREQNRCLFWLQPSAVEGYGHAVHEGLAIGALVATVDGPPMNEAVGLARLIPARKVSRQNLADVWESTPEDIARTAERMWSFEEATAKLLSEEARAGYLKERDEFRAKFRAILEGL